ncbi:RNA-binding cell elongation regulator Jag/EloR [Desulfomonile tiedjei]|uniref:RNA-binding protein KhpB n=1 Tax=Desulfomonile tiedjei (strain ATCC 49306 / DSM 6799 / DCB-1) TaxID=706587 RepID=I4CAI9_DESTA|nr:RNA-binding cell elongation regulator Jag/EloR [Desulfomonile tiedjei]AFM26580.1 putative RNA-binding protein [Desulfomonile tiedjei DSM 6799]
MSDYYEFTGKTVKEAIARACEELKIEEALLDIEVLEESTRGFLGLVGQRDAKIRVRRRDILKEVLDAVPQPAPEPEEPAEPGEEVFEEAGEPESEFLEPETETEAVITEADSAALEEARTILEEILKRIPVETEIDASIVNGAVYLDIKGDGSGLLIGKKGQTLDALQFLVNKIINKNSPAGEKIEVVVDTENYRMRKTENLREMAIKMSQKAKKTLKPVSFNPMPPHERRIIHLILAEDKEVYTKSYGEGALRRIIVYPRRGMSSKRRRR